MGCLIGTKSGQTAENQKQGSGDGEDGCYPRADIICCCHRANSFLFIAVGKDRIQNIRGDVFKSLFDFMVYFTICVHFWPPSDK